MAEGQKSRDGDKDSGRAVPAAIFTDDYFVFPHIGWMIAIPVGFYFLFMATFNPDSALRILPWPLNSFIHYMGRSQHPVCVSLCVFAVVAHCVEAAYTGKVCLDKRLTPVATAKWSFMTFLFGFASLSRLLSYKPGKAGDKQN